MSYINIKKITLYSYLLLIISSTNLFSLNNLFIDNQIPKVTISAQYIPKTKSINITITPPQETLLSARKESLYIEPPQNKKISLKDLKYPYSQIVNFHEGKYYNKTIKLLLPIEFNEQKSNYTFSLNYQLCNKKGVCFLPQKETFSLEIPQINKSFPLFTLLFYSFLALLGGLLLNIMPCTLPVLGIKALSIIQYKEKKNKKRQAFLYLLGTEAAFLIIAVIVTLIQNTGNYFNWGFQFQNSQFLFIMVTLMITLGLSLTGLFPFPFLTISQKKSHSHFTSFFQGFFIVPMASACTAPLLAPALGYLLTLNSPILNITTMTIVALGLSLPILLISFYPQLIRFIPKTGTWTISLEKILGLSLILTGVYLTNTLLKILEDSLIPYFIWSIAFIIITLWLYGQRKVFSHKVFIPLFSLFIICSLVSSLAIFNINTKAIMQLYTGKEQYKRNPLSEALLNKYQEEKKTIFINFTADWCNTCKFNELITLNTARTKELFSKHQVEWLTADLTTTNSYYLNKMAEFNRNGIPLYILYKPNKKPMLLPTILTTSTLKRALN